jgi:hypothetical protein
MLGRGSSLDYLRDPIFCDPILRPRRDGFESILSHEHDFWYLATFSILQFSDFAAILADRKVETGG